MTARTNGILLLCCIIIGALSFRRSTVTHIRRLDASNTGIRCRRRVRLSMSFDNPFETYFNGAKTFSVALMISSRTFLMNAEMASTISLPTESVTLTSIEKDYFTKTQSPGWEMARQKRTAAIKAMEEKGMLQIDTDDVGNQFLKLPWIPDRKVPYKSLSIQQRLTNEVSAGAFGEISKDILLHAVDTAKTRKQATKKKLTVQQDVDGVGANSTSLSIDPAAPEVAVDTTAAAAAPAFSLATVKDLYAGFPVVLITSIPQGGAFFLVKKGIIEIFNVAAPNIPQLISATVPIGFAVMAYWGFRTPAEVIKTQVQTGASPNVKEAFDVAMSRSTNGYLGLWKYYPIMLWLDIPFQIINFVLYGAVSDAVLNAGFTTSVWTRLFCGVTCGMVSAAATCPVDVCKTRIISREKAATAAAAAAIASALPATVATAETAAASSDSDDDSITQYNGNNSQVLSLQSGELSSADAASLSSSSAPAPAAVTDLSTATTPAAVPAAVVNNNSFNVPQEILQIAREEGVGTLFLGIGQRLLYVGLANGIRLAAYGTSRMDLMMRSLDDL